MIGILHKLILVLFSILLLSCAMSPGYWFIEMPELKPADPNVSQAAKQGLLDGCQAALKRKKVPSMFRDGAHFRMNGDFVEDGDYRTAWSDSFRYCALRADYGLTKSFLRDYDYLDPKGDSFSFKR